MPDLNPGSVKTRRPRATLRFFLFAVGVLATSILVTYFIGAAAIESSRRVARERSILQDLENLISSLKDAETGQRGYLLTGDENYLEPYRDALARIRLEHEALHH